VGETKDRTSISDCIHVDTKENLADIIARDCCPLKLTDASLWWCYLNWLIEDEAQ